MQRFLPTLLILVPLAAGGVSSHVTGGQDDARVSNPEPQERGPCDDPVHRQFDFWIGDWDVSQEFPQPDGSIVRLDARSTVSREMEGCALLERWRGEVQYFWEGMSSPDSLQALSVRAWDAQDGVWRIHWMDTRSPRRWVTGGNSGTFEDGVGTFHGPPNAEGWSSSRIRFHDIRPDSVEWDLASRQDPDAPWMVLWRMHFRRR
jgi:hypothetical protein